METTPLKPLNGLKVLVTRPKEQAPTLSNRLRILGAIALEVPTITISPPESYTQLDVAIQHLQSYDWIIFTSVHGVQFFLNRVQALGFATSILYGTRVAAVGSATASALEGSGRKPDYVPEEYLTERIAIGLGELREKRILLPRADIASKRLPEKLRALGAKVDEISTYRTGIPSDLTPEKVRPILARGVNLIVFTSPSTVQNLTRFLDPADFRSLSKCKVACIGPVTAQTATELGFHVDIVAKNHTINALVEEIVNEIGTV
jgi:uroporphyrinogen III methyltransferase/synthase